MLLLEVLFCCFRTSNNDNVVVGGVVLLFRTSNNDNVVVGGVVLLFSYLQ